MATPSITSAPSPSNANLNTIENEDDKAAVKTWLMNKFLEPIRTRTDELIGEIEKELKD